MTALMIGGVTMRYSIPEWNIESLEKKITKIRNKCEKYGCEFKYERLGEHFDEVTFSYVDEFTGAVKRYKQVVKFVDVEAEGTAAINGWRFAATLEYTKQGNIIDAVPGIEIPKRFYDCGPWCEHCKTNRDRKYSFVVFEEETGEFKQVGKSCLKDFTGGLSADNAAYFESFFKEIKEATGLGGYYGFGKKYYETKELMTYFAETIRVFGYAKTDSLYSTADRAQTYYDVDHNMLRGKYAEEALEEREEAKGKGFNPENPESIALAGEVIDWITNNERDDNYFHNMKVALSLEYSSVRNFGLLASAFPAHNREIEREAERRERERKERESGELSKHVGEVGKRVSFKPTEVVALTSWETQFGVTTVYKFVDESGNVFTWKTGNWVDQELPVLKITGTVKEHKEYRGVKQTELTRCRIEYGKKPEKQPTKEELEANAKAMAAIDKALDELCCA